MTPLKHACSRTIYATSASRPCQPPNAPQYQTLKDKTFLVTLLVALLMRPIDIERPLVLLIISQNINRKRPFSAFRKPRHALFFTRIMMGQGPFQDLAMLTVLFGLEFSVPFIKSTHDSQSMHWDNSKGSWHLGNLLKRNIYWQCQSNPSAQNLVLDKTALHKDPGLPGTPWVCSVHALLCRSVVVSASMW